MHTEVCKHGLVDIWITVLVLAMHDHHWNGETGVNLFGQTERRRDRGTACSVLDSGVLDRQQRVFVFQRGEDSSPRFKRRPPRLSARWAPLSETGGTTPTQPGTERQDAPSSATLSQYKVSSPLCALDKVLVGCLMSVWSIQLLARQQTN